MTQSRKPWFAGRPSGQGSGWPVAWQGWLVLAAFFAGAGAALAMLDGFMLGLTLVALTVVLMVVTSRTTASSVGSNSRRRSASHRRE
jgi:hypothetical protein